MMVDLCLLFENEAPGKTTFVYENFVSLATSFNFSSFNFFYLTFSLRKNFFPSLILLSEKIHDFCVTFHDFILNSLEYFSSPYVENSSKKIVNIFTFPYIILFYQLSIFLFKIFTSKSIFSTHKKIFFSFHKKQKRPKTTA